MFSGHPGVDLRIAAVMSSLVRSGHFGLGGLPLRLERATIALKAWCKMNRRNVVFRKFSADNLTFKRGKVPEMKAKGYDCFVVLAWLAAESPSDRDDLRMEYALIWLADSAMQVLSHAGSFLTDLEAEHVRVVGEQFLKVWIAAAHGRPMQFKVRPKFHILHHAFLEASSRPSRRNVWEEVGLSRKHTGARHHELCCKDTSCFFAKSLALLWRGEKGSLRAGRPNEPRNRRKNELGGSKTKSGPRGIRTQNLLPRRRRLNHDAIGPADPRDVVPLYLVDLVSSEGSKKKRKTQNRRDGKRKGEETRRNRQEKERRRRNEKKEKETGRNKHEKGRIRGNEKKGERNRTEQTGKGNKERKG